MADLPGAPGADPLAFTCPRCGGAVTAAYYGPCPACRDTLRATLGGAGRTMAVEDYVPKVNVTPNAVALKDD